MLSFPRLMGAKVFVRPASGNSRTENDNDFEELFTDVYFELF